ncbi:MAG: hypothetical protein HFJ40_00155 [Clostridia bacterium]|nr:hypothetical protein [Clostridia bacterium]
MKKEDMIRKIVMCLAFGIGIAIIIGIIMCVDKISNTNTEDTSALVTIEDLQEQIKRQKEELQYKENKLEELEKENEEHEELIELLRTQLEELNVEPFEL